jgi:hypothetical protein
MNMAALDSAEAGLPCLDGSADAGMATGLFAAYGIPIVRTRRAYMRGADWVAESVVDTVYIPYEAIVPARERSRSYEEYALDNLDFNTRKLWMIPTVTDVREGDELDDGEWVYRVSGREGDFFRIGVQQVVVQREGRSPGYTP